MALDHNVVLNNLDDDLLDTYVAKYVDDLTIIDTVDNMVRTDIDNTSTRQLHTIHPQATQTAFNTISSNANKKGLKINENKTQLLSVSSAFYDTKAVLKDHNNDSIVSGLQLKMLGFIFGNTPSIQPQLDYLIRKASKRYFMLLHYKRAGLPSEKLKEIYCAITRSTLEYSSNVYHSMLNIGQSNELEKVQKRCLRAIYGYDKQYLDLLQLSGLETLKDRRIKSFEKFATNLKKTLNMLAGSLLVPPPDTQDQRPYTWKKMR